MSKLLEKIFDHIDEEDEKGQGSDVENALQKALDNTTVERAGCPWDTKKPDGSEKGNP